MLARAACTASAKSLFLLLSFEAPIVSNAVMTKTLEPTGVDEENVGDLESDRARRSRSEALVAFCGRCSEDSPS